MAHRCDISGKSHQFGNRVSHAKNRTRRMFKANLQTKRLYIPSLKKYVRIKVSTRMLRTIDKLGIEGACRKYGVTIAQIAA